VSIPLTTWVAGARPRTLPAAIVPVVVGTAAGYLRSGHMSGQVIETRHRYFLALRITHHLSIVHALLALVVALGFQVGTNFVNDYADGERGTDEARVGPVRLVAGRLATVRQVKVAALLSFAVAGAAGLILAMTVTWWFIPVGLLCALAGWAYTGGTHPYGYYGFGEVFVFIFFGLVATAGSAYVQHAPFFVSYMHREIAFKLYRYPWGFVLWVGVPVGLLAAALLQANNLRDIKTDTVANKKTLAVRLGRKNAGRLYCFTLMGVALAIGWLEHYRGDGVLLGLLAMPLAFYPVRLALSDREDRRLLPMLGATSRLQLAVGLLLTIGLLL
jgi:1,4-dihydroxy-2-naphthoate octaprenyltransferase